MISGNLNNFFVTRVKKRLLCDLGLLQWIDSNEEKESIFYPKVTAIVFFQKEQINKYYFEN